MDAYAHADDGRMTNVSGTIKGLLSAASTLYPERVSVVDRRQMVTYGKLMELVNALANKICSFGNTFSRVAILMPNDVRFVISHFAVLWADLTSVPLDPNFEPNRLSRIFNDCSPQLIIVDDAIYTKCVLSGVKFNAGVRVVTLSCVNMELRVDIKIPAFAPVTPDVVQPAESSEDISVLMYTSGTMGIPKGVIIQNRNVVSVVDSVINFVPYESENREVIALPLSHSFGMGQMYCSFGVAGAIYINPDLMFPERFYDIIRTFKATGFSCTPAMLGLFIKARPDGFTSFRAHLRYCVVNSAALPTGLIAFFRENYAFLDLCHYYGLTEASRSTFISYKCCGKTKYLSVGRSMKHARIKIVAQSRELAADEPGEIAVSGSAVSCGYWGEERAKETATHSEWFLTGDIGRLDTEGYLYILGRVDDCVNIDGRKFYPAEVECAIAQLDFVSDVGVVALPAAESLVSLTITAAIVAKDGVKLDIDSIRSRCSRNLSSFKIPKVFIIVREIPRFPSGKIDRGSLLSVVKAACNEGKHEQGRP